MKVFVLLSILFSISLIVNSQKRVVSEHELWIGYLNQKIIEGKQYPDYKGTPYIFETDTAQVFLDERKKIEGLTIRYNVYNDLMEIKKGEKFYNIPKENIVPKIKLGDHVFVLMPYKVAQNKEIGYFESILEDKQKCSLFIRHKVVLKEGETAKPFQEARPPMFKKLTPMVFVTFGEDHLIPVYNKKLFIELIPDKQEEMAQYIKNNKTKFKKPDSVKQLVEYYNSL